MSKPENDDSSADGRQAGKATLALSQAELANARAKQAEAELEDLKAKLAAQEAKTEAIKLQVDEHAFDSDEITGVREIQKAQLALAHEKILAWKEFLTGSSFKMLLMTIVASLGMIGALFGGGILSIESLGLTFGKGDTTEIEKRLQEYERKQAEWEARRAAWRARHPNATKATEEAFEEAMPPPEPPPEALDEDLMPQEPVIISPEP